MIRRKGGGSAFAITTQLIKKADGTKFGKTESGAVWLDPAKTSPYKFYQFWLNTTDDDAKSWIRIFTLKSKEEIEALERDHDQAPHLRILQKSLADEITIRSHSDKSLETAIKTSEFLFGNGSLEFISTLNDKEVLEVFEGLPQFTISKNELEEGINVTDLLAEKTQIFPSKGEAKKMISGGGVSINKEKLIDASQLLTNENLINGKYLVAQRGKKNYFLIIAE
jgi:tyrosyl-tRNA synthetase